MKHKIVCLLLATILSSSLQAPTGIPESIWESISETEDQPEISVTPVPEISDVPENTPVPADPDHSAAQDEEEPAKDLEYETESGEPSLQNPEISPEPSESSSEGGENPDEPGNWNNTSPEGEDFPTDDSGWNGQASGDEDMDSADSYPDEGSSVPEDVQSAQDEQSGEDTDPPAEKADGSDSWEDLQVEVLTGEHADDIVAADPEAEELVEEIESGELIALVPLDMESNFSFETELRAAPQTRSTASIALLPNQYRVIVADYYEPEEMKKREVPRLVEYVDNEGVVRRSPLYCLNASKKGIPDDTHFEENVIRSLDNDRIKKLLFFGYGGPGDASDEYDPTCEHINWELPIHRYLFTHCALSYEYSRETGVETVESLTHYGVFRYDAYIQKKTIPSLQGVQIASPNIEGNMVYAKDATAYLHYYRTKPSSGADWLESTFNNGFMATSRMRVQDTEGYGNGFIVTRRTTDVWQMIYWVSAEEAEANPDHPHNLSKGQTVILKDGYRFRFVFPKNAVKGKLTCSMLLCPAKYLLVDGDAVESGGGYQDFGASVYQEDRGKVSITFIPSGVGAASLSKTSSLTGKALPGAQYAIYAAEKISEAGTTRYSKGQKIAEASTDSSGTANFRELLPGKYYIKETKTVSGYLLESVRHDCTVKVNATAQVKVEEIPDITGQVLIHKTDEDSGENLEDAEFTLYTWNGSAYTNGVKLTYDAKKQRYVSAKLKYTTENQGKFRVSETKNPEGYMGSWSKNFVLDKPGQVMEFPFEVTNSSLESGTSYGSITIIKKIRESEITWAHGNPTFSFVAEGTDTEGHPRRYEASLQFKWEHYDVDGDGYAMLSTVIRNVPTGSYQIYEKQVLRYYLYDAEANTSNVSITKGVSPAYGQNPKNVAYGTAVLSEGANRASITFVNKKSRFDDYSHNDYVENTIPITF